MAKKGRLARRQRRKQQKQEESIKKRRKLDHKGYVGGGQDTSLSSKGPKGLSIPFDEKEKIILIGEGDFSYAVSIVEEGYIKPENLIATSFDTLEELKQKYPEVAEANLKKLNELMVKKVVHGVDGTKLIKTLKLSWNPKKLDRNRNAMNGLKINLVLFNFPHVGRGIKDMDRNIKANQEMLVSFFTNCKELFELLAQNRSQGGEKGNNEDLDKIAVTLFDGEPYNSWQIKQLIRNTIGYKVRRSGTFDWKAYKEYHHRKTAGMHDTTKVAKERAARTYLFEPKRGGKRKRVEMESESESE
ncbi:hypothetical protein FOA43_000218 [Brettanomyces nanus]|uniref:25S rRNA (uridine-N(3))-methyltransferase BMT5-like domain-containing protein n=1 Tax=Eeniella nana TaxID=13502 RepID=A0A875RY11_EENNA|nr:uncharacterized protein FOA43_000218 [Brettanomyces nanus]QPG72915.1 hypothetical protein FOA43_000218 [Brettanomyces nanus]